MELVEFSYGMARDWHIQPSEFWAMSPTEFWWEFDAQLKVQKRLDEQMKRGEMRNGFSVGDWEDGKAKFRAMKNG